MPLGIIVVENNVNLEEVRTHITRLHEVRTETFIDTLRKLCPCNIQFVCVFFSPVKIENFVRKILIFFLFLLKT